MAATQAKETVLQQIVQWLRSLPNNVVEDITYEARLTRKQMDHLLQIGPAALLVINEHFGGVSLSRHEQLYLQAVYYRYGFTQSWRPATPIEFKLSVQHDLIDDPRYMEFVQRRAAEEIAKQMLEQGLIKFEMEENRDSLREEVRFRFYQG